MRLRLGLKIRSQFVLIALRIVWICTHSRPPLIRKINLRDCEIFKYDENHTLLSSSYPLWSGLVFFRSHYSKFNRKTFKGRKVRSVAIQKQLSSFQKFYNAAIESLSSELSWCSLFFPFLRRGNRRQIIFHSPFSQILHEKNINPSLQMLKISASHWIMEMKTYFLCLYYRTIPPPSY